MRALPTGTVTFLFTDIEGSTRMLQELGDRYAAVHDDHGAILRRAIEEGGGVEVSRAGDSFFAAFPTPLGALRAAVAAQRDLASHGWPPGWPVRVRMGLHTGEAIVAGDDYMGIAVNRAARIAAVAHGGQVVVSEVTRGLVAPALPEGVALRDLGEHRLKDIAEPEHLFDLTIEGLPADFPPLRTAQARPNNLPVQLTSFIGRERVIAEVKRLLGRTRILTLTGAGGTGKTRLALQVASELLPEFEHGCFFADLSALTDPHLVPSAVAQALGVAEVAGRPIVDAVRDHLRDRELLLVVDNFEQVAEAGPMIEELSVSAPKVKVMVTSRVVLSLRGEQEYMVPPLEPPDPERVPDVLTLGRFEAVRLFTERALAVRPEFRVTERNAPAVAAITARLDGLPLAIELAATRTKVLSPEQILPRLEQRLTILTSGARTLPERQRTLRGAIAWSHDLLDEEERRLFARLSVFSGGWTLASAEAVCDSEGSDADILDGLTSLVNDSLVRMTEQPDGDPRFSMLETIREFAQEQLAGGDDRDAVPRRHAEHYLGLALEAEPHLTAEDQREWLDRCDVEHANIRAALRWAIHNGEADRAQEAAGALWRFWQQRGHLSEGGRWFDEVLAMPSREGSTSARAKALIGAGGIAWWRQDRKAAGRFYQEAVAIERGRGDPKRTAEALYNLAFVVAGDDLEAGSRMLEESMELFRQAEDEHGVAQVRTMLVMRDAQAGAWDRVVASLEEGIGTWRRLGNRLQLAFDLVWLGFAHGRLGHLTKARSAVLEAIELFGAVDNQTGIGIALIDLAFLANWEGRHAEAIALAGAYESVKERVGGPPGAIGGILEGDPAAEARAKLSEEEARRAWDEGRAMSTEEAVAFARDRFGA